MKEELNGLANHIAGAKGGLPQEWQDWASEIEMDIRKLANREAQPVAVMYKNGDVLTKEECGKCFDICCRVETPLYTAPPAVVVNPEFTGAPAVPDEQHSERFEWTYGEWAKHLGGRHQNNDPANYYEFGSFIAVAEMLRQFGNVQRKVGWNACRAAMLAQPVRQGYKLVPVEPTAEMIQSGIVAHYERQQLQIHDRPAPGPMECAYIAMLAAAPEEMTKEDAMTLLEQQNKKYKITVPELSEQDIKDRILRVSLEYKCGHLVSGEETKKQ